MDLMLENELNTQKRLYEQRTEPWCHESNGVSSNLLCKFFTTSTQSSMCLMESWARIEILYQSTKNNVFFWWKIEEKGLRSARNKEVILLYKKSIFIEIQWIVQCTSILCSNFAFLRRLFFFNLKSFLLS